MNERKTETRPLDDAQFAAFSREMEIRMQKLEKLQAQLEKTRTLLENCREDAGILYRWYFEGSWLKDRDREEKHPLDQSCGVYSEDGLYNLFMDLQDLCGSLEEQCRGFRRQMESETGGREVN